MSCIEFGHPVTFGSVCSGIEAASVAWSDLMTPAWFSQHDPEHNYKNGLDFPSELLAYRHPDTENLGDMLSIRQLLLDKKIKPPDVLVGGTPCQAFSVAGMREGLADERGKLTMEFVEIANAIDAVRQSSGRQESVIVWENVPGVLSSKDNSFGCFLGALAGESCELKPSGKKWSNAGCVYGPQRTVAWRVLDAQYFGLTQRRKRVFVVASARNKGDPTEILFEFEGLRRDTPPSRTEREAVTSGFREGFMPSSFGGYRSGVGTLRASGGDLGGGSETLISCIKTQLGANDFKESQSPITNIYPINTMTVQGRPSDDLKPRMGSGIGNPKNPQNTLSVGHMHGVGGSFGVRKLTPIECERLQGFPDNYTQIPWRGKTAEDCPDGHRYKALGNTMAVMVMRWIGLRLIRFISPLNLPLDSMAEKQPTQGL